MFDLNEIRKRAQQASEQAADSMKKTLDKSQEILDGIQVPDSEDSPSVSAAQAEEQIAANTHRPTPSTPPMNTPLCQAPKSGSIWEVSAPGEKLPRFRRNCCKKW